VTPLKIINVVVRVMRARSQYYNRFINFFSVKREQVAFLGMEKSGKGFFIKNLQGSNLQFCPQMLRTKVQNI